MAYMIVQIIKPSQILHTPFPSSMSSTETLWCTNSKSFSPSTFMQYPTIPKEVCNLSSPTSRTRQHGPSENTHPSPNKLLKSLVQHWKTTETPLRPSFGNVCESMHHCAPLSTYPPCIPPQETSSNSQEVQCHCPFLPPTAVVTDASKYLKEE